jgi:hypothetical protein
VIAAVLTYVALHFVVTAGLARWDRARYEEAPARAAAFISVANRYAQGDSASLAELPAIRQWFEDSPRDTTTRYSIESATAAGSADAYFADNLAEDIAEDQAVLDRSVGESGPAALNWAAGAAVFLLVAWVLRRRRRDSAAEIVEVVSRFVPPRPWWRRPVFLVLSGLGSALLLTGFVAGVMVFRIRDIPWSARGFILLGCVVTLIAGVLILRPSRPRSARSAVQTLRADGRKPVLYLRSFADDRTASKVDAVPGGIQNALVSIHTREEQLADSLNAIGPVVAVGKPKEPLPHLGAARFYLPYDDWRPAVLRLMELSQLIVLRLGPGEGLWWEVEQARTTQPADKLVLLIPGDRDGLAERLDEFLPTPSKLDKISSGDSWTSAVVTFDPQWTPQVYEVGPHPGVKTPPSTPAQHVARAMQGALAKVRPYEKSMVVRTNLSMLKTLGKGLLLIPVLALFARFLQPLGLV